MAASFFARLTLKSRGRAGGGFPVVGCTPYSAAVDDDASASRSFWNGRRLLFERIEFRGARHPLGVNVRDLGLQRLFRQGAFGLRRRGALFELRPLGGQYFFELRGARLQER